MSATTSTKTTKTKKIFGPGFDAVPTAGYQAGQILKDEAIAHLQSRNWKAALQVAEAAQQLRSNDVDLYATIAVAAAYSRKHGVAEDAVRDLRYIVADKTKSDLERADGCIAIASVRLAQSRYTEADTEARKALAFDSEYDGSWWCLAAGFAGLGWFEEADECWPLATGQTLDQAANEPDTSSRGAAVQSTSVQSASVQSAVASEIVDQSDPAPDTASEKPVMPFAEWQVGRAINSWGMAKSPTWIVAIVGIILFGPLGLALAASTPFIARELRVMRLEDHWKTLAETAWKSEHKLRIAHALVSLSMVTLWVVSLAISR